MFTIFTLWPPGGLCTQSLITEGSLRTYKILAIISEMFKPSTYGGLIVCVCVRGGGAKSILQPNRVDVGTINGVISLEVIYIYIYNIIYVYLYFMIILIIIISIMIIIIKGINNNSNKK